MRDLPIGWASTVISDVATIITGSTPPTKVEANYGGATPFVKPSDLDNRFAIARTDQSLSDEGVRQSRLLRSGAVLVSCIGNLGKVGITAVPVVTNQQINAVEFAPSAVVDRYGYYYCKTLQPWIEQEASATTIAILNKGRFSSAPFLLAPFNEQKRIADKIDALLARVDVCRDHFNRVPLILKHFRLSVLTAATSGKLTEDWRVEKCILIEETWSTEKLKDISADVTYGYTASSTENPNGPKMLRITDIQNNRVDWDSVPYCKIEDNKKRQYLLKSGDLVFARTGATVGKSFLIRGEIPEAVYASYLIRVRCNDTNSIEYLSLFFQSNEYWSQIMEFSAGVAQPSVNGSKLKELIIPLPSVQEQHEIVRRVEALFAYADRLEARYQSARAQVEKLTPAILAKAFRGELVPQDPRDESASMLLERIRATHAEQAAKPKQRKTVRISKVKKFTADTLKATIERMPKPDFTFDDLRSHVSVDYETLKDLIFELLADPESNFKQVFDMQTREMRFQRVQP